MITRDEWLHALGEASMPDPDALTSKELAAQLGFGRKSMEERLKKLVEAGTVRRVVTIRNGRRQFGFLLVKKGKRG